MLGQRGLSPPSTPEPPRHRMAGPSPADWETLGLDGFRAFTPNAVPSLEKILQTGGDCPGSVGAEGVIEGECEQARNPAPRRPRTHKGLRRPCSAPGGPAELKRRHQQRRPETAKTVSLPRSTMLCGVSLAHALDSDEAAQQPASMPGVSSAAGEATAENPSRPSTATGSGRSGIGHGVQRSIRSSSRPRGAEGRMLGFPRNRAGQSAQAPSRASSTGALERRRPASAVSGKTPPPGETRVPQGTHLQGSSLLDSSMACSWLTSEPTAVRVSADLSAETSALRAWENTGSLDYSNSMSMLEVSGSRVSPAVIASRSLVVSPALPDARHIPPTGSFILGVPLGLETAPVKQTREISAVLPRVSGLEFGLPSELLPPPVADGSTDAAANMVAAPAVPAATLASQVWVPTSGENKWRRLPSYACPAPAATTSGQRLIGTPHEAASMAIAAPASSVAGGPSAMPEAVKSTQALGQLAKVFDQALRKPRSILSSSSMNQALPARRLSTPSAVTNYRPSSAVAPVHSAAACTPSAAITDGVAPALKVPPSRSPSLSGFKSVEAVINERRREAAPAEMSLPPPSARDTMTCSGLPGDGEDWDADTTEETLWM